MCICGSVQYKLTLRFIAPPRCHALRALLSVSLLPSLCPSLRLCLRVSSIACCACMSVVCGHKGVAIYSAVLGFAPFVGGLCFTHMRMLLLSCLYIYIYMCVCVSKGHALEL